MKKFLIKNLTLIIGIAVLLIGISGITLDLINGNSATVDAAIGIPSDNSNVPNNSGYLPYTLSLQEEEAQIFSAENLQNHNWEYFRTPIVSTSIIVPDRILIPSIGLDAPVVPSVYSIVEVDNVGFGQFEAPNEFAAGWHTNSAGLGEVGNTVINGHHNVYGRVFEHLVDVQIGDLIYLYSGNTYYVYQVSNYMILPERDEDIETRRENARWLLPTTDERLTLVTCWPIYSNTHRLIIVARPVRFVPNVNGIQ
jgi:LPXTG-site transpeptidase (sortase) family protein